MNCLAARFSKSSESRAVPVEAQLVVDCGDPRGHAKIIFRKMDQRCAFSHPKSGQG